MLTIDGKMVLTSLEELVAPSRAALLLVDMQRDFVDPDGAFGRLGLDLTMYPAMRQRLGGLLASARRAGVFVIHVQMGSLEKRVSDSPAQIRFNLRLHAAARRNGPPLEYARIGAPGREFVAECQPMPNEPVISKWRSSGFFGTSLDLILRSNRIETVVVAGCTTEGCVESTARDAMFSDYYVVIAEDCVASDDLQQHAASLLLMRHRFDLASADEIRAVWAPVVVPVEGQAGSAAQ